MRIGECRLRSAVRNAEGCGIGDETMNEISDEANELGPQTTDRGPMTRNQRTGSAKKGVGIGRERLDIHSIPHYTQPTAAHRSPPQPTAAHRSPPPL